MDTRIQAIPEGITDQTYKMARDYPMLAERIIAADKGREWSIFVCYKTTIASKVEEKDCKPLSVLFSGKSRGGGTIPTDIYSSRTACLRAQEPYVRTLQAALGVNWNKNEAEKGCWGGFRAQDENGKHCIFVALPVSDSPAIDEPEIYVSADEVDRNITYTEGAVAKVTVNAYERDPQARQQCIDHYGAQCFVCNFDFGEAYGEVGEGFIHVHHLRRLADIGEEYAVNPIGDLRPVCPNCHAIIHRRTPPYSIVEVQVMLRRKA